MNKIYMELELVAFDDGSAHDLEYFWEEVKELYERFGWKVTSKTIEDIDE